MKKAVVFFLAVMGLGMTAWAQEAVSDNNYVWVEATDDAPDNAQGFTVTPAH